MVFLKEFEPKEFHKELMVIEGIEPNNTQFIAIRNGVLRLYEIDKLHPKYAEYKKKRDRLLSERAERMKVRADKRLARQAEKEVKKEARNRVKLQKAEARLREAREKVEKLKNSSR